MKIPFFTQRKNIPAASIPAPSPGVDKRTPTEVVMDYHEQTKHHYYRFARSLGYLDWDTQPNPFRRFEGSPLVRLPLLTVSTSPSYEECYECGVVPSHPVDLCSVSRLLRNTLALSAWKSYGESHWSLRVNPSSGDLHPTEGYVIGAWEREEVPGVYHYAPQIHGLERRATLSSETFQRLTAGFPDGTFFVGFTSIHWREAWKYGERAYRYCQHDLGHAIAAMRISAAVLGWQFVLLDELSDSEIAFLLGLNRAEDFHEAEDEYPHCIGAIVPSQQSIPPTVTIREDAIAGVAASPWIGHANRLSVSHVEWEIIDEVTKHSAKPRTDPNSWGGRSYPPSFPVTLQSRVHLGAEQIIQQRRSAVAMDGVTSISADTFFRMLARVMPDSGTIPFDALQRSELAFPRVHLAIFVHRVDGLDPGLYLLVRNRETIDSLKGASHPGFAWSVPPGCLADLPLYCLQKGDLQRIAAGVSCGQDIAGDGVFSLGMIVEFEQALEKVGAWLYPRLFWETGVIGQILYLEAEAAGVRATGIGCFFDDPMHELLGFRDRKFQSLYHFTVGGPVEDTRLTTEPPYENPDEEVGTFHMDLP